MFFQEIAYSDPLLLAHHAALFLDSCQRDRYSFLLSDPLTVAVLQNQHLIIDGQKVSKDPFTWMHEVLQRFACLHNPDLPPFQGGLAGYLGYEMGHYLEKLPQAPWHSYPDMIMGIFDKVYALDHIQKRSWIFASTKERLLEFEKSLIPDPLPPPLPAFFPLTSSFTKEEYIKAILRIKKYIREGDIYQANMTRRLSGVWPTGLKSLHLYQHQRAQNPSPFSAFFSMEGVDLLSSSPERFMRLHANGMIETYPMKGTRPRGRTPLEDARLKEELRISEKDQAENLMIVDLMRNDLSRVANHIIVPELFKIQSYPGVHQMISHVQGQKKDNINAVDILKATFPGGSITGAPKIRAQEILCELERTARGPYCGCMGYIGFSGTMDMSITIRTLCRLQDGFYIQVGGGIVDDSIPEEEYEETEVKARSFYHLLFPQCS